MESGKRGAQHAVVTCLDHIDTAIVAAAARDLAGRKLVVHRQLLGDEFRFILVAATAMLVARAIARQINVRTIIIDLSSAGIASQPCRRRRGGEFSRGERAR